MNLTGVIIARNEEKDIKRAVASLGFCDEVVVIDSFSSDSTPDLAKKLGAKVFYARFENDFSRLRNFGLKKAGGKWVLFLDADEEVPESLGEEITEKIGKPFQKNWGFYIKRDDYLWGSKIRFGETSRKFLRLARRHSGTWKRAVHEYWDVAGRTSSLRGAIKHYPHQSVREFVESVNFHSSLHAGENMREGKKSDMSKIVLWPPGKFLGNYLFKLGFLDGTGGFVISLMMSFHSFLAWSKLWMMQKR